MWIYDVPGRYSTPSCGVLVNFALKARTASRRLVPTAFSLIVSLASLAVAACHQPPPPAAPAALVVALPVHHDTGEGALLRYPLEVAARDTHTKSCPCPTTPARARSSVIQ